MIVPSKFTEIDKSSMVRCIVILEALTAPISVTALYERTKDSFETAEDFILALDVLWVLEKINVNLDVGVVSHAS